MKKVKESPKLRLNLGILPQEGFAKVDWDYAKLPWPLKDSSVEEMTIPMRFNYIPGEKRGEFMDEVWRVLVPDGKVTISVPYYTSMRAIQDHMAAWPPFCEISFMYFNRDWRKANHPERNLKCHFDFSYGYQAEPETANKNDETRSFFIKHYVNSVTDLVVVLTKKL